MECLRVLHWAKGPKVQALDSEAIARVQRDLARAFHLDSCQRLLWACWSSDLEEVELPRIDGFEIFAGTDAYRFLLRVATGLESQIVGETDIFGQLKEAWRKCPMDSEMVHLIERVFEDTKDIRSRYLQNLGGASYGSLVRMMLKQSPGPRMIVGAGQLAQAVAPFLLDEELWILYRSQENAQALAKALGAKSVRIVSKDEEAQAWQQAASVVICVPFDEARDAERIAWRKKAEGPVIHLGGHRKEAGAWNELPAFEALDDLFALKKAQGDVRVAQVRQAARACDEKAKLRALGASVTLPHGWEDLAVFA